MMFEIDEDGDRIWKNVKGKRHREDGPAFEGIDGNKSWWENGLLHREDGPAIESSNGTKKWFLDGIEYTEIEYLKR